METRALALRDFGMEDTDEMQCALSRRLIGGRGGEDDSRPRACASTAKYQQLCQAPVFFCTSTYECSYY